MPFSGVLVIDKPMGLTSHDVVNRVRRKLGTRKVGHGGTLDPDVTGVLVLCVGAATRLLEYVSAERKTYEGSVLFGESTETDDATGVVVATADASALTEQAVKSVAAEMTGWQDQVVPRYSAVHIEGRRAYELARAGIVVDLPSRQIHIETFCVWDFVSGVQATAAFQVTCSKGTYIRSLCRDWGSKLGIPAHMKHLRRTESGRFKVDESVPLDTFERSSEPSQYLLSVWTALREVPQVSVNDDLAEKLVHGQTVRFALPHVTPTSVVAVRAETDGELVAITQVLSVEAGHAWLKPKKVFWKREQ